MELIILNEHNAELYDGSIKIANLKLKKQNDRTYLNKIFVKNDFKEFYTEIDIANIIFDITNEIDVLFK